MSAYENWKDRRSVIFAPKSENFELAKRETDTSVLGFSGKVQPRG